ncbi:MAG: FHA domain-containing protein [Chloroflexi bacterium]|nr:FHA domain-containing protein [Chloroflexota bacterium]
MPTIRSFKLVALLCLCSLFISAAASAQTGQATAYINDVKGPQVVQGAAGTPGLSLELGFTLLDADKQVMTGSEIESVAVELANGSYPAVVQKLETPWSIVILVDGSTTMANFTASAAYKTARTALATAIEKAPKDATFAVLKFDNGAPTVLDFTTNADKIKNALLQMQATFGANSCLNNGAYEAVNKLASASGRRAVIIFTASADNCAQRTAQDVAALAKQNHIQIYSVGLKGFAITEQALESFSAPSGGLASLKEENALGFAFGNVMAVLNNQWQAKATLYPSAGPQSAQIKVTLKDTSVLTSAPIQFTSNQDYPSPPRIRLKGEVQSISDGFIFNLDITSADKIKQLSINVINKSTGLTVNSQTLTKIAATNKVLVNNLANGKDYQLTITAADDSGRKLDEIKTEFKYAPSQPELVFAKIDLPTVDKPQFVISVEAKNLEGAVKYELWLSDERGTTAVDGTKQTVPIGEPLSIPAANLASGEYRVVVRALDSNNKALAEGRSEKITYQSPGALDVFVTWIQRSPLGIASITIFCCLSFMMLAVIGWIALPKRAAQPKSVELVMPEKMRRPPPVIVEPEVRAPPRPVERPRSPQPAPILPKASLTGYSPADVRVTVDITKPAFTIGRVEGNDLVIPVDNTRGVSSKHAVITFTNGKFYLQDEQSTYGTSVNDQKIPKGTPTLLEDGAIIGLGPKVKIQFHLEKTT